MGKKNKKEKEELKVKDPENAEDNDKVSIKKTFRDTGIIMGLIGVVVGILIITTKDAVFIDAQEGNEDNENDDIVGDPEVAYENLVKLANKELIDVKNLSRDLTYVASLVSIEYSNNKVVYCGLGNEQDGVNYLIKVTMNYSFGNEDSFIYKMTTLNLNNAVMTYGVSAEAMDLDFTEAIHDKFDDKVFETLPKYDMDKVYIHSAYTSGDDTFFAVTYAGTDSNIYSINEMLYNDALDEFTITSEYGIGPTQNAKMYALLEKIIA